MREPRYRTVHEDLVAALPELRRPYERLFAGWDHFGGGPPGQYLVFSETLGTLLEIVLTLPEETRGREDLLRRALTFAEALLDGPDAAVESLAIDAVAETLDLHPAGRTVAERLGGPRLRAWFALHGSGTSDEAPRDEIIDLWGVREELAQLLPATELAAIPGISHPADHLALATVEDAKAVDDGTVLLSTFGTSHLYVVLRAADVALDAARLDRAAKDIAAFVGGDDLQGEPGLRLRRIPTASGSGTWTSGRDGTRGSTTHPGSMTRSAPCGRRSWPTSRARRTRSTSPRPDRREARTGRASRPSGVRCDRYGFVVDSVNVTVFE